MFLYESKCIQSCPEGFKENLWTRNCEKINPSFFYKGLNISQITNELQLQQILSLIQENDYINQEKVYFCQSKKDYFVGFFSSFFQIQFQIVLPQVQHFGYIQFEIVFSSQNILLEILDQQNIVLGQKNLINPSQELDCGNPQTIDFSFPYQQTNSEQLFRFIVKTNNNSFAVRNLTIQFSPCHSSCLTCIGEKQNQCLTCIQRAYLQLDNTCKCESQFEGFPTSINEIFCKVCYSPCSKCFRADTQSCLECIPSFFLYQNTCIPVCPLNITVPLSGICLPCPQFCSTCDLNFKCISCIPNYLIQDKICVQKCSISYIQQNQVCIPCSDNCLTCQNTIINCTSCNLSYFLNEQTQVCIPCDDLCIECFGISSRECSKCSTGAIFIPQFSLCTVDCSELEGYFFIENSCQPCYPKCKTCISQKQEDCLECIKGYTLQDIFCVECFDNQCSSCFSSSPTQCNSCNKGFYLQINTCIQCPQNCMECYQISLQVRCLQCSENYFLQNFICVNQCVSPLNNQGYYANSSNRSCELCNDKCAECSGSSEMECLNCKTDFVYFSLGQCLTCINNCLQCLSSTDCISCLEGFVLSLQKQCQRECPQGQYLPTNTSKCELCSSACSVCTDKTTNSCSQCQSGFYLEKLPVWIAHKAAQHCFSECPSGFYFQDQTCVLCPKQCMKCISAINCNECASGYFLLGSICLVCDIQCISCKGLGPLQCLKCNFDKYQHNNECILACPHGFYSDLQKICLQCPFPCSRCSFNKNTEQPFCTECVIGFLYDLENLQCISCDPKCAQCEDQTDSNCQECTENYFLNNTTCLQECPPGKYANIELKICLPCSPQCKECSLSAINWQLMLIIMSRRLLY
ncbi:zinc finger lsd1 subclass family protein, putative [Ichthyophthirius multifiliis]|uniref:Zinc finger lsd1 subclass family protein, putative n=1 Tax=Ichthyophthirius multifiliis TaxID=5932 RepID=G0QMK0_ICHMU|nr:zinc finger lsd1 subclass family protein, putative [Ichthyophthirius multifiliis]EGR33566.1 zinc finger lsd1 subclass family protein, putative [Ichthyophthirius multifiliis]|eukprot:XP_004037552.1 zinc finger lsd1 subclass family protein, putative [Ichthyophthirius multifiliis]